VLKRAVAFGPLAALLILVGTAQGASTAKVPDLVKAERVTASSHGQNFRAHFGSFCWRYAPPASPDIKTVAGLCVDTIAFTPPPRLPIHANGGVTLRTEAPARAIHADLRRLDGSPIGRTRRARRVNKRGTRWRVFLPRDIGGVRILGLDVDYTVRVNGVQAGGHIPFSVGVRVHQH
jgi:hypothetical protein